MLILLGGLLVLLKGGLRFEAVGKRLGIANKVHTLRWDVVSWDGVFVSCQDMLVAVATTQGCLAAGWSGRTLDSRY